jgi:hypothetical protein
VMVDFTENELNAIEESISIIQGFMRMYKTNPDINHINEISQYGEVIHRICLQPLGRFFDAGVE